MDGISSVSIAIPIGQIDTDPAYAGIFPPLPDEEIAQLKASIGQVGILMPLCVKAVEDRYVVLDGHHRLAAARALGFKALPCLIAKDPLEEVEMLYSANLQRRQLDVQQHRQLLVQYKEKHRQAYLSHYSVTMVPNGNEAVQSFDRLVAIVQSNRLSSEERLRLAQVLSEGMEVQQGNGMEPSSDAQVLDFQNRLKEAEKLCRKLIEERDRLRESVEFYESAGRATSDSAAVKHANKELADTRRRLADLSQTLKAAHDERDKLKEELEAARRREDVWIKAQQQVLQTELEVKNEENEQLRRLLNTSSRALGYLRQIRHLVDELGLLLDHQQDPWPEAERQPVVQAYEELVTAWEGAREALSLALQGLPPGRSTFDRMFPDKRHREPLERYREEQAGQQAAPADANGSSSAKRRGRKRERSVAFDPGDVAGDARLLETLAGADPDGIPPQTFIEDNPELVEMLEKMDNPFLSDADELDG